MDMFVVHRKKRSMVFFLSSLLDDDLCFQCVGISYVYCFIGDRRRPLILSFITLSSLSFPIVIHWKLLFFCAPLFFSLICPHDFIFFFSSLIFFFSAAGSLVLLLFVGSSHHHHNHHHVCWGVSSLPSLLLRTTNKHAQNAHSARKEDQVFKLTVGGGRRTALCSQQQNSSRCFPQKAEEEYLLRRSARRT